VHARLLQELREAVPDINTEIRHSMVRDLPYLNAVINESLRVRPVGAADPYRAVPEGGAEICGKYIPAGVSSASAALMFKHTCKAHMLLFQTEVLASQHMLNFWDEIWDEPAVFRPERWLTDDDARLQEMKRAFYPFSMGVRSCTGREYVLCSALFYLLVYVNTSTPCRLAWMELRVALASVIRRFDIEVLPGDDMTPICSMVVRPRGHSLTTRLTKRVE